MVLLGKIMILQGVGHPISCLGVCYANDPKKGGYTTPAPALDLTTSLRRDFLSGVPTTRALFEVLLRYDPWEGQSIGNYWSPVPCPHNTLPGMSLEPPSWNCRWIPPWVRKGGLKGTKGIMNPTHIMYVVRCGRGNTNIAIGVIVGHGPLTVCIGNSCKAHQKGAWVNSCSTTLVT